MKQTADFATYIRGIPCGIVVDYYHLQKPFNGSAQLCNSDIDYYGYEEADYTVLDRKGYPAKWLYKKMDDQDKIDVVQQIADFYK